MKYSLFLLEMPYRGDFDMTESCFNYIDTFDTLKEAKSKQEEYELKTIILQSY